jgi:hypothetical protein
MHRTARILDVIVVVLFRIISVRHQMPESIYARKPYLDSDRGTTPGQTDLYAEKGSRDDNGAP